jgi:MFS family permease
LENKKIEANSNFSAVLTNDALDGVDERTPKQRMHHFLFILIGQVVSIFGSSITSFSLGVWAYQNIGSVAAYTSIFFAGAMGMAIASPFSGVLVDRLDKKKVLILSSVVSALISCVIATFYFLDSLEIWVIILCAGLNGIAMSFSTPAITASVKLLIDPDDLARANGMSAAGFGFVALLAPVIAGFLLLKIELIGVLIIDISTFVVGLAVLSFLRLPKRELAPEENILKSIKFAWAYLKRKDALLWLIGFYFVLNFLTAGIIVLVQPLILTLTDASGLGSILTIGGFGYLCGAILIGVWGGPKRKIFAVYVSALFMGFGMTLLPLSVDIIIISIGIFFLAAGIPVSTASNQTIIQRKVSSSYIGRVDGLGRFFINIAMPMGYIVAGTLAELYFEPFMMLENDNNAFFVDMFGVGKGRGIALMVSIISILLVMVVILATLLPKIRRVELELEDED